MEASVIKLLRVPFLLHKCKILINPTATLRTRSRGYRSPVEGTLIDGTLNPVQRNFQRLCSNKVQIQKSCLLKEMGTVTEGNQAFLLIKDIVQIEKADPSEPSIVNTVEFKHLCDIILKDVRGFSVQTIIRLFKIVTLLKVPSNTVLVQTLLQMLRTQVNEIPLWELARLGDYLRWHRDTPLAQALRIAIKELFKFNIENLTVQVPLAHVSSIVRQASFYENAAPLYKALCVVKEILTDSDENVELKLYIPLYYTCAKYALPKLRKLSTEILTIIENSIIQRMSEITVQETEKLITAMSFVNRYKDVNERLLDLSCNVLIRQNADFDISISFIAKLTKLNYSSIPLIDYVAGMSFAKGDLGTVPFERFLTLLEAMINVDYKPVFWDILRRMILEKDISHLSPEVQLKLAIALIALDCYHPELIENAFINNPGTFDSINDAEMLLELYQSVQILYPPYYGEYPTSETIERLKSLCQYEEEISLKSPLTLAIGGARYIRTKLKTKLGHVIDYAVVIGNDGKLVDIAEENCGATDFIEDMERPPNSQTILIFNFPKRAYSNQLNRLNSRWQLKLKSIEALTGHSTLAINFTQWDMLPDYEKIPYLAQAVRLKYDVRLAGKNL